MTQRWLAQRLGASLAVQLLVTLFTFALVQIVPGDAAVVIAGQDATPEQLAEVRQSLGLDAPWHAQLLAWYGRLAVGDLGQSFTLGRGVAEAIAERLPVTLGLALYAIALTLLLGIGAGVVAALRQNSWIDRAVMVVALLGVSLPNFWIAIVFVFTFAVQWELFPTGGYVEFLANPLGWLHAMTLPAVSLALLQIGLLARITRAAMIETLRQDYVRTAVARGLPPHVVVMKHAFRNVLIPVVTVVGILFSLSLAGAVVIETVYSLPGIGRLVISGIGRRDLPVIQGTLLVVAALCMAVNLAADLLYAWLDPRVEDG